MKDKPNTIILGIDPGSRKMGFGVITVQNDRFNYLDSGVIIVPLEDPESDSSHFSHRLGFIHTAIVSLITKYNPNYFAIEEVFVHKNSSSALKLGQARGAAIVAAVNHNIQVCEYSARLIKQAVVGKGSADKYQIQQMVRILLNLHYMPKTDEADALAIAICHANSNHERLNNKLFEAEQYLNKVGSKSSKYFNKYSKGRWQ
ncbi:MAG: crossover junction endodeoxyribonuclease RuvC [Gammaproteobacteria bacterium]|nr:crossover junction endodeoxyribonuclease RuvC [Gammaproteobacteria bacterium]